MDLSENDLRTHLSNLLLKFLFYLFQFKYEETNSQVVKGFRLQVLRMKPSHSNSWINIGLFFRLRMIQVVSLK
jgi:hypothetical protein